MVGEQSRRNLLRNTGKAITGLGAAGSLATTATAENSEISRKDLWKILHKKPVINILEEVGRPYFDLNRSVAIEISSKSEKAFDITYYMLQTGAGVLMYAEGTTDNHEGAREAMFKFGETVGENEDGDDPQWSRSTSEKIRSFVPGLGRSRGSAGTLREQYQNLTDEQNATVLANAEETQFVRDASDDETELLAEELDLDAETTRGFRHESGFYVVPDAVDRDHELHDEGAAEIEDEPSEQTVYDVDLADGDVETTTVSSVDQSLRISSVEKKTLHEDTSGTGDVGALGHEVPACLTEGIACVSTLALCFKCMGLCVASSITGIGALLICLGCWFLVCHGVTLAGCTAFLICWSNHYAGDPEEQAKEAYRNR